MHALTIAPERVCNVCKLYRIIRQARRAYRPGANYDRSALYQIANTAQHGQGHVLAEGIKRKHLVAHTATRREFAVLYLNHMQQRVCIHIVETVALRNIRMLIAEDCGDVGVLAVEGRECQR